MSRPVDLRTGLPHASPLAAWSASREIDMDVREAMRQVRRFHELVRGMPEGVASTIGGVDRFKEKAA